MLTMYRRHKETCPHRHEPRNSYNAKHKCKCPIWIDGVLAGEEVRKSIGLRDWTSAARKLQKYEAEETISNERAPVTLAHAWASIVSDLEARKLSHETIRKYKQLETRMTAFAADKGLLLLTDFDVDTLSRFRFTWKDGPRTAAKTLERLRALFRFAEEREWVDDNPASRLKVPKVSIRPTMPLTGKEMVRIFSACDAQSGKVPLSAKRNLLRLKTLVLLLRYSGMRISDAVTMTTDRLDGKRLFLYTQKTGVPVYTVLPDSVLQALDATPRVTSKHYFWTGDGKIESIVRSWQTRLKKLFDLAGVPKNQSNAVSHRFRDTFAVELLLAGVPIERVSVLLGHQSVRVTEKHYNPWVRSRQEQLEADVARTWAHDPVLMQKLPGTKQVQFQKERPN
ncbi:MAG: tyrosine-type recombinase/integrase [Candidatus Acidiferrales bacterium]